MNFSSNAFENGGLIPLRFATAHVAGGANVSIPYHWSDIPPGTKSLALSVVDHHRIARNWVHWLVVDINPKETKLAEGASGGAMPSGALELLNSYGYTGYGGPQPPPGTGPHLYVASLYALNAPTVALLPSACLPDFLSAIINHVLIKAEFAGKFER